MYQLNWTTLHCTTQSLFIFPSPVPGGTWNDVFPGGLLAEVGGGGSGLSWEEKNIINGMLFRTCVAESSTAKDPLV